MSQEEKDRKASGLVFEKMKINCLNRLDLYQNEMKNLLHSPEHAREGLAGLLAEYILRKALNDNGLEKEYGEELMITVSTNRGLVEARTDILENSVFEVLLLKKSPGEIRKYGRNIKHFHRKFISKSVQAQKTGYLETIRQTTEMETITKINKTELGV